MTAIKVLGASLMAAAVVACGIFQWERHEGLEARLTELEREHRQFANYRTQIAQLVASIEELRQRRAGQIHVAAAHRRSVEQVAFPGTSRRDISAGFTRLNDLRNVGNASPKELYESYLRALNEFDMKGLKSLVYFDETTLGTLHAFYSAQPKEIQEQFGGPRQLFLSIYASEQEPPRYVAIQILGDGTGPNPRSPTQFASVHVGVEYQDGRVRDHQNDLPIYRGPSGWQIYFYPQLVMKVLGQFDGSSLPAR